ncbi:hypothetical protein RDI58_000365 [Solanum bulbocastanum]|uniref:Pentatricopeptide repeat-containing protein n=1 Tax=Solanum bulbocastanum TaxID=147425 RepID=A0AAN8UAA1_SOLBU
MSRSSLPQVTNWTRTMFGTRGAHRFSKKLQPFEGFPLESCCWFSRTIINHVHSFTQSKQRRPVRRVNRLPSKSTKSVPKKDIDLPKVFMRDTVTRISHILRFSTWDSAQEQLMELPIKWDSYTVNQVLKTHPPMEKAWLFFSWASKLKGFKHDQFTYTTMLDIFGEAGRISSMNYIFQQMQDKGIKIDAVTYTSLLHWLSDHGDINESIKLWQDMKDKGCVPNVVCYTAYMKGLFDHNRVKEGAKIYKEMLQSGCSPNCHTYTVLMEHLASSGKFDGVLEIFSKMQDAGVQPDKATCNILVGKCCKAGETQAMMKILHYMKENFLVLRYSVYQEAFHTLKMAGVSDRLLRDVNRHLSLQNFNQDQIDQSDGIAESNCFTLDDRMILHLLNKKSLLAVDYLLDSLMNKRLKLDPRIVSTVVEVNCSCGRVNGAFLAFEVSVKLGITIERITYLTMVGELIRTNSFSRVVDIVEPMVGAGLSLGSELTALLIHRLGCAREPASAEKLFRILPDQQKSIAVYTALISTYFTFGNADKGLEIFETMRKQGINLALSTYCVLLNGLERNGLFDKLQSYRKEKKRFESESCSREMSMEETYLEYKLAVDAVAAGMIGQMGLDSLIILLQHYGLKEVLEVALEAYALEESHVRNDYQPSYTFKWLKKQGAKDVFQLFAEKARDHKGLVSRWAVLQETRVEYFRGKDFVTFVRNHSELKDILESDKGLEPEDIANTLLQKNLLVRCDRVVKIVRPGKKKLSSWPAHLEIYHDQVFSENDAFFAWAFVKRRPLWQTLLSFFWPVLTLAICLFPVYPH